VTRPEPTLADRVALALIENGPLSCEQLARLVKRRTSNVRDVLRADSRFAHVGDGRASRWRLVLNAPTEPRDGLGRIVSEGLVLAVVSRLDEQERRLLQLERRLDRNGASAT
jgi:hypothetical protein